LTGVSSYGRECLIRHPFGNNFASLYYADT
jgi:hypothetical protein